MSEYYAVQRSDNSLKHYGVKGMKWGVRKALAEGGSRGGRKLTKQYNKAVKKLAKLEKRASSGSIYAKRARRYAAGAAAAGGLAAAGTEGIGRLVSGAGRLAGIGASKAGHLMSKSRSTRIKAAGAALSKAAMPIGVAGGRAGGAIAAAGRGKAIGKAVSGAGHQAYDRALSAAKNVTGRNVQQAAMRGHKLIDKAKGVSNNTYARIGAGAVGLGLGIAAGRNAYKAASAKRYAKKAAQFRSEMNKAFAGTKYANGAPRQGNKRRRRS